jgi:hypothetical protein
MELEICKILDENWNSPGDIVTSYGLDSRGTIPNTYLLTYLFTELSPS